jgi:endo-1,4-beta-xylanase
VKKRTALLSALLGLSLGVAACAEAQPVAVAPCGEVAKADAEETKPTGNLAAHYASHFTLGVALEPTYLDELGGLIVGNFNRITAENAMKCGRIHPREGTYFFPPADRLADFARQHSMKMTGHALVWHQETPDWLVAGDRAAVAERLRAHIEMVVARYADVTDNWDVVNEGISDSADKTYRDGGEGSKLFAALGEEYISLAFSDAAGAVKASGKAIDLYYNDYNLAKAEKRAKVLEMVKMLRAKGIQIDGVGEQAHWNLTWPSLGEIQAMIDELVGAGLKLKISELDISMYPNDDWGNKAWEPEQPFTAERAEAQARRYRDIFALFVKNAASIESVTLWGVSDDRTWLDTFPTTRNNQPLLFDDADQPKPAYFALLDL